MAKKFYTRALSVGLSLALCAGLVAPGFAAQELTNENKGTFIGEDGALKAHDGNGNVAADDAADKFYDYALGGDVTLDKTLVIGAGVAASIELNGHTLELNDTHSSTGSASTGLDNLTVKDSSKADAPSSAGATGQRKWGSVIKVAGEGAELAVTDSTAIDKETGEYVAGKGTGAISGGYAGASMNDKKDVGGGAGVRVSKGGSFTMKGGSISENLTENGSGGGVYVNNGTVELDNVTVKRNSASSIGGGIYAENGSTVTIKDSDISQNRGMWQGNGIGASGKDTVVTVEDSTVSSNRNGSTTFGGGIYAVNGATVNVTNTEIKNNSAKSSGGGVYSRGSSVTLTNSDVTGNSCTNGVGGVSADGGSLTIKGGSVSKNITTGVGSANYGLAGGIHAKPGTALNIENATVCGNTLKGAQKQIYDPAGNLITEATHGEGGWDEGKVTKEATCAEEGVMTYTCKYCKETKTEPIPMKEEHSWDTGKVTKPATCTAKGKTTYTCTVCGETKTEEDLDMVAHKPGEPERVDVVDATCSAAGSYTEVIKCTECGEEISREPGKTIGKLDHTPGIPVRENETAAQIGIAGSYEEVVYCTVCQEELSRETKSIAALQPTPVPGSTEIDEPDVPLAGLPPYLTPEEPEDKLTRAQAIAVLHWMDNEPAAELATFLDVLAESDCAEAIGWAQANGIALGVGGNRFAPDEFVTRGQLVDFLNRYAVYVGSELVYEVEGSPDEVLTWAKAEEIINGFFARLYETEAD